MCGLEEHEAEEWLLCGLDELEHVAHILAIPLPAGTLCPGLQLRISESREDGLVELRIGKPRTRVRLHRVAVLANHLHQQRRARRAEKVEPVAAVKPVELREHAHARAVATAVVFQKLLRLLRKARGVGHDLRREHIGAPGFGHQPDNIQRLRERLRRRRRVIDLAGRARQVTVILVRPLGRKAGILQQRAGGDGDIPDNAVCSGKNLAVIAILRPRIPPGLCHQQHAKYWNEWQFFQTVRHRTFQRHKTHQQRHAHRDARNRNAQRHIG